MNNFIREHGLSDNTISIAVKTDLETKLRDTLATLLSEIGQSTDTTSTTIAGILNTPNATINSSSSAYIKSLARMIRTNHRADIREIRLLLRELSSIDNI